MTSNRSPRPHRPRPPCGALALLILLLASTARAVVLTWSADDPFQAGDTAAGDFGVTVSGITALEAVVSGSGGVQHWTIYQGIDNPSGDVPFEMTLTCVPDGGNGSEAAVAAWLPILAPFTEGLAFAPPGGWAWLQDGAFALRVSYVHGAFPDNPLCYGTGYTLPAVTHLELRLTCAATVPVETGSWGAVKALYR